MPAPTGKGKKTPEPTPVATSPGTGNLVTTEEPTIMPTMIETDEPTITPTSEPTARPTGEPTVAPSFEPTMQAKENDKTPKPTSKKGGKNPTEDPPTIQPTMDSSFAPTKRPVTEAPVMESDDELTQPPIEESEDDLEEVATDMSFSYYLDMDSEDFEFEWGRDKMKKDKMDDDKDDKDIRGRGRLGGQRRRYYHR